MGCQTLNCRKSVQITIEERGTEWVNKAEWQFGTIINRKNLIADFIYTEDQ